MKKWLTAMLGAAAMTMSVGALAQQPMPGWYVGGDFGKFDIEDEDDTAWRIVGGYQINRTFAAELGYSTLFDKSGVEVTAWELVGIASFPVANKLSIFGKLGFAMWEADAGSFGSTDGTDLTFGAGVQYDITPKLGIRGQWQRYDIDDSDGDLFTVGLIYKF
jgi:OmpA-OmpF porin, OOP family